MARSKHAVSSVVGLLVLCFAGLAAAQPNESASVAGALQIMRAGSQPSGSADPSHFVGEMRVDPLFRAPAPARIAASSATFEPGARTKWHTHPLGQLLIVTAGRGRVQAWGGPLEDVYPGDVIWTPPGVKHWHGASPTTAMTHLSIVEAMEGVTSHFAEPVSEDQYNAAPAPSRR